MQSIDELRAAAGPAGSRAPLWLVAATLALTLLILYMAVAETTLWGHYLVDRGELICLAGLAFILVAGLVLHRQGRLFGSLPLIIPWVIYPVVTQGDQLIDNLTINQMRFISHVILAILFAAPVVAVAVAAVALLAPRPGAAAPRRRWTLVLPGLRSIEEGRISEGVQLVALTLLLAEIWIAHRFLGTLMIGTLIVLGMALLISLGVTTARRGAPRRLAAGTRNRLALAVLLVSIVGSLGLYLGYKNRPGAYQGSPHHLHDPDRGAVFYPMERIAVPAGVPTPPPPELAPQVEAILRDYGEVLEELYRAYHLLDRNYNYAFHNELFMRNTPLVPDYRAKAMARVADARPRAAEVDRRLSAIRDALPADGMLPALLDDLGSYVAYNLERASTLEEMTARFERTRAGLQHATHLYEGEGKILGVRLMDLTAKHRATLEQGSIAGVAAPFLERAERIHEAYANRIVGF